MNLKELKQKISKNNDLEKLFATFGCHSFSIHDKYINFANPDGNNKGAVQVFNDTLCVINYTRDISTIANKSTYDIFDLVAFYLNEKYFPKVIKHICNVLGYNYYSDKQDNVYKDNILKKYINKVKVLKKTQEEEEMVVYSDLILNEYIGVANQMFADDGIDVRTQIEFELGLSHQDNCITIPIRNELSELVGVKARQLDKNVLEYKYFYIYNCNKSKVLYGLNKTYEHILKANKVYVFESEKSVMQMWSNGYKNSVSTGGKCVSKYQVFLLEMLGVEIVFCFDKDVNMQEVCNITKKTHFEKIKMKFKNKELKIGYMFDKYDRLGCKDSFSDKMQHFSEYAIKY